MGRPAIVPLTFLKINASVNIRHVSVVAVVSLHEQNTLEGNSVAVNRRCASNRHCNEYDRSIAVAPLTAPTKCRHVFFNK